MKTVPKPSEFEDYAVEHCYAINGPDKGPMYPPLPTPSFMLGGVPLWSRDLVIEYGKAVERCSPACFDYGKGKGKMSRVLNRAVLTEIAGYLLRVAAIAIISYLMSTAYVNYRAREQVKDLGGLSHVFCSVENLSAVCAAIDERNIPIVVTCKRISFDYFECAR